MCSWRNPTGRPRCPYPEAVKEAICFEWIDSTNTILDEERGILSWDGVYFVSDRTEADDFLIGGE